MTDEQQFLARYDPRAFPAVAVAVDLVGMGVVEGALRLLLIRRAEHPAQGAWALPGSLLQGQEDLDVCAARTADKKLGLPELALFQFAAFGTPGRDPRLRVVSIGYLGLGLAGPFEEAGGRPDRLLARVRIDEGRVSLRDRANRHVTLAFDHQEIALAAIERLRVDLDRTTASFALLAPEFTLRELQIVHEAVKGGPVNKPAFRKRLLDSGRLEAVGRKDVGGPYRPAELYRLRAGAA
jgi:8-oxo-dGTP diphosphatase